MSIRFYVELSTNRQGEIRPVIAGTRIRVHDIVAMYVHGLSSIEWIVENFDLTPAQIHAALAYYYDHQAQIDREIMEADEQVRVIAETLEDLKARIQARQSSADQG